MRGYEKELRAKRDGQAWRVAASPKSPDLPLMRKNSYQIRASTLQAAVSDVETTMDEARRIASNIAKLPNYLAANPDASNE
jgi:hypothetical protein